MGGRPLLVRLFVRIVLLAESAHLIEAAGNLRFHRVQAGPMYTMTCEPDD
jgi:hypothetical protein